MAAVERIVGTIERVLGKHGPLRGKRVVVTAGATREAIDPIRILTNRSSGKMGYAIARAALLAGAEVTLISAPTNQIASEGIFVVPVESAIDLLHAVQAHAPSADALIMAAAVADYRPRDVAADKIKKTDDDMSIALTRNPDILASVETPGVLRVGFAAETRDHEQNARGKLDRKNLDLIVANDARQAMGADSNAVMLYYRDGRVESTGDQRNDTIAAIIVERVASLLSSLPKRS
jgi:phosphopantothenoylcysteine decarboxylase/phosphopantothenate--cysteine ligase